MREIKFRAWNGDRVVFFNLDDITEDDYCAHFYGGMRTNDNTIVEQYTGLKDKNNTDACENDICDYEYWIQTSLDPDSEGKTYRGIGVIVYVDGCFMIQDIKTGHTIPMHYPDLSFGIIGNIHENPELMEQS